VRPGVDLQVVALAEALAAYVASEKVRGNTYAF